MAIRLISAEGDVILLPKTAVEKSGFIQRALRFGEGVSGEIFFHDIDTETLSLIYEILIGNWDAIKAVSIGNLFTLISYLEYLEIEKNLETAFNLIITEKIKVEHPIIAQRICYSEPSSYRDAIINSDVELLRYMLVNNLIVDIDRLDKGLDRQLNRFPFLLPNDSALILAVIVETYHWLAEEGSVLKYLNEKEHQEKRKKSLEMVRLLLENGANPNIKGRVNPYIYDISVIEITPLMASLDQFDGEPDFDLVKTLLIYGADPNMSDTNGKTPLNADHLTDELETLLRSYGATVGGKNRLQGQ